MEIPPIEIASVKVMRSHDYCHFEVCLSSSAANSPDAVDALRKTAARLADKAVEQYKLAKENAQRMETDRQSLFNLRYHCQEALKKPEAERTPEDIAKIKTLEDRAHRNRPRYDYEDDWAEEDFGDEDDNSF